MRYIFWGGLVGVLIVIMVAGVAWAAPPYTAKYRGPAVTTAVPGQPFTLKLAVKNTGTTVYSGVKVTMHVPEGLTHSMVAPANASIHDDIIQWSDVPIAAGKSFYPEITFTLDKGTPLKTKKNIWVEVTGQDMEANSVNFSITAVPAKTVAKSTLSAADISSMFQSVYGRAPSANEQTYWLGRRSDKPGRSALLGAMGYHQTNGISH